MSVDRSTIADYIDKSFHTICGRSGWEHQSWVIHGHVWLDRPEPGDTTSEQSSMLIVVSDLEIVRFGTIGYIFDWSEETIINPEWTGDIAARIGEDILGTLGWLVVEVLDCGWSVLSKPHFI